MAKQERIRIRLKAYDHKTLDQSAAKIVDTAKRTVLWYPDRFRFRQKRTSSRFFVLPMSTKTLVNSSNSVRTNA